MQTKILIWYGKNGGTAEAMLNAWLKENSTIEIVRVTQSEAGEHQASRRITFTIWYKV